MKYTPENVKKILSALKVGHSRQEACELVNINHDTFYEWLKDPDKSDFVVKVKRAERQLKNVLTRIVIRAAMRGDEKMALEILSRRFPDDWSVLQRNRLSGHVSKTEDEAATKDQKERVTKRINEILEEKMKANKTEAS